MRKSHFGLALLPLLVWSGCSAKAGRTVCGNDIVEGEETCDGDCPVTCDDNDSCTTDVMIGSPDECNVVCEQVDITTCVPGDGCCPAGCTPDTDADCAVCGDGVVEGSETCDGDCPATCDDGDDCTEDTQTGSPDTCDMECTNDAITTCVDDDGCCPAGCDAGQDNDCTSSTCGNTQVEPGEECDDGNTDNTDFCLNNCQLATCGDGVIWAGQEACDDGVETVLCDSSCQLTECASGMPSLDNCPQGTTELTVFSDGQSDPPVSLPTLVHVRLPKYSNVTSAVLTVTPMGGMQTVGDDFSTIPENTSSSAGGGVLCTSYGYCDMTMSNPLTVVGALPADRRLHWDDAAVPFPNRWYAQLSHSYHGGNVTVGSNGLLTWRAEINITRSSTITAVIAVGSPTAVEAGSWVGGRYVACTYHDFFTDVCTGGCGGLSFDAKGLHTWEYEFDFVAGTYTFRLDGNILASGCTIPAEMLASGAVGYFGDQGDNTNYVTADMSYWEIQTGSLQPSNVQLEVGTPDAVLEWEHAGDLTVPEQTGDLSAAIEADLATCTADATGDCLVPFYFTGQGDVSLGALSVNYCFCNISGGTCDCP